MNPQPLGLLPYQERLVDIHTSIPHSADFTETGLGKTAVFLTVAENCSRSLGLVVIVTKKGLISQMRVELGKWAPSLAGSCAVLSSKNLDSDIKCVIATPEMLRRQGWKLERFEICLTVIDEASSAGNGLDPNAKTFVAFEALTSRSQQTIVATATPANSRHLLELQALMTVGQLQGTPKRHQLMAHIEQRTVRHDFRGNPIRQPDFIHDTGVELLLEPLRRSAVRAQLRDAGQALPVVNPIEQNIPLSLEELSELEQAQELGGFDGHLAQVKTLRGAKATVEQVVAYLTTGPGRVHEKTILQTEWFDLLDPIVDQLNAAGLPTRTITGRVSKVEARQAVVDWHHGVGRTVIAGTAAIEQGLNLQNSSQIIAVFGSWSPASEAQLLGRAIRIGSPHRVVDHVLFAPNSSLEQRRQLRRAEKELLVERVLNSIPGPFDALSPVHAYQPLAAS